MIQKKNRFELGYKPNKKWRKKFIDEKREKRIASFLEKESENAKIEIPLLSCSFCLADFINLRVIQSKEKEMMVNVDEAFRSLTIGMIRAEELRARNTRLPLFPRR